MRLLDSPMIIKKNVKTWGDSLVPLENHSLISNDVSMRSNNDDDNDNDGNISNRWHRPMENFFF